MNALTIAELRLRQAELAHKAEKLRQEWRTLPATSTRASVWGKQVKDLQQRADDYASILEGLEPS